jgi:hypothetical protein
MSNNTYQPGQSVSINPSNYSEDQQQSQSGEFAALVQIVSSRYTQLVYPPNLNYSEKIAIEWTLRSTKDNIFNKSYSTGLKWNELAEVSPDGRRLISKSPDFTGFKPSSDGLYLLRKVIASGFPAEQITDDIGVFDGHCFFLTTDVNPAWKGSSKKPYPKTYHPEGFEAARSAREAARAAKQQGGQAQMTNSYTPPPVVVGGDALAMAGAALVEILAGAGGKITKTQIPAKINEIAPTKGWSPKQRQDVTLALWDNNSLGNVVTAIGATLAGDTISLST